MLILGFDPGGDGRFGWCVTESTSHGRLDLRACAVANHAKGAVEAALESARPLGEVKAAGIDSPLFWDTGGDRCVDQEIRKALSALGAKNAGGTVQHVNSLRGACLVQGVLAAHLLRERLRDVRITETHPKALLWLLKIATRKFPATEVKINHLRDFVESGLQVRTEHGRDAVLGAVAALAMIEKRKDWRNLYPQQRGAHIVAVVPNIEYWMPLAASSNVV